MGQGKPSKVAEQTLYQGKKVKRRVEDEKLNVLEQRLPATTSSVPSRSSASATISQFTRRNLERTEPEDKKLSVVTDAAKIHASTTSESLPPLSGGVASALGEDKELSNASQEEPVHTVKSTVEPPISPTTSQIAALISRPGTGTAKLQREDKAVVTTTQEDSKEPILPPIQPKVMPPLTSATSEPLPLSMASAGTAKPQGKGKELETVQEDPVEPEQPPTKPRAKDESSSNSHARRTSRKKKHRQTRHKSRYGEWEPGCCTYIQAVCASRVMVCIKPSSTRLHEHVFFHF